jgi:ATP-dependent helicase YprA (DUF1998 family)
VPINPVQFAHNVCDEFLRYLFSAFPLADPELADQARKLLHGKSSLDIPLVQGPFISLSEAFSKGDPVQQLADRGVLHAAMPGLIGYPTLWRHQQQVFEAVRRGEHVLVATGTATGKTEAFLYPIVDDLLRQRDKGVRSGLTAILIYPMNALANDQLDRLRDMLGGTGITFGQWVGTTPDAESDVTVDRFEGSSRQAYLAERRKRREVAQAEDRAVRPLAPPEECCSSGLWCEAAAREKGGNGRSTGASGGRQPRSFAAPWRPAAGAIQRRKLVSRRDGLSPGAGDRGEYGQAAGRLAILGRVPK